MFAKPKDNKDPLSGDKLSTVTPQRTARPGAPPLSLGASSACLPGPGAFANRQDSGKVITSMNSMLGPATSFPQLSVEPRLARLPAEAPNHLHFEMQLDQLVMELEAELLLEPPELLEPFHGKSFSKRLHKRGAVAKPRLWMFH